MKTHYETLGVSRDASIDEIKQSYRKLSLKWHPDRNSSPEAQSRFQEISSAYETLSDEKRRHEYNCELDGVHMMGGGTEVDISDIFNMMFNGGGIPQGMGEVRFSNGGPEIRAFHGGIPGFPPGFHPFGGHPFFNQMQKPQPIITQIVLTFEQAYSGCTLCANVEKWTIKNNTKVNEMESVYVNIPPGIDNGEIIIMRDCGNTVSHELKGDIKFIVKVEPSGTYERRGMDLLHKRNITLKEALTGFSFELTHINGKLLCLNNLKNRTIISPNYQKTIPNLGMIRDGNVGNLIIEFSVNFPDQLTNEQMTKLEEIL